MGALVGILFILSIMLFCAGGVFMMHLEYEYAITAFISTLMITITCGLLCLGSSSTEYHQIISVNKTPNGEIYVQTSPKTTIQLNEGFYIISDKDIMEQLVIKYTLNTTKVNTTTNYNVVVKRFNNCE
jgi:hypothetical protein